MLLVRFRAAAGDFTRFTRLDVGFPFGVGIGRGLCFGLIFRHRGCISLLPRLIGLLLDGKGLLVGSDLATFGFGCSELLGIFCA